MFEIAIIGCGTAGAAAAMYTARAGKSTIVFDHGQTLAKRAMFNNYYGFVEGITGIELYERGKQQVVKAGAMLKEEEVIHIEKTGESFTITTEAGAYQAKQLLLATGIATKLAEQLGIAVTEATEPKIPKIFVCAQDGSTAVENVWVAGTAAGTSVHVQITSGDGARVAMNMIAKINGARHVDHDLNKG